MWGQVGARATVRAATGRAYTAVLGVLRGILAIAAMGGIPTKWLLLALVNAVRQDTQRLFGQSGVRTCRDSIGPPRAGMVSREPSVRLWAMSGRTRDAQPGRKSPHPGPPERAFSFLASSPASAPLLFCCHLGRELLPCLHRTAENLAAITLDAISDDADRSAVVQPPQRFEHDANIERAFTQNLNPTG